MANADHLILAVGVSAIVVVVVVGAVLQQPPVDIRIETTQESYRIGEEVVARLENLGPLSLCTYHQWPWSITRHVGDEWLSVTIINVFTALGTVRPGDSLGFRWVAESHPDWEELVPYGFAEVVPGEYRVGFGGRLCDETQESGEPVGFYAYFELVE